MSHLSAYYSSSLIDLAQRSESEILGVMAKNGSFSLEILQRDAWRSEISILKDQTANFNGHVFLEFEVPRIGSRIDAVIAIEHLLVILEFKVGEKEYHRAGLNQAWDYALDLKNFHEGSHDLVIIPVLVATEAAPSSEIMIKHHRDGVYEPVSVNRNGIRDQIEHALTHTSGKKYSAIRWANSAYKPTPTIIEAAQRLFSEHSVEAISRHDAGKQNLSVTAKKVEGLVDRAAIQKKKKIIFVTGVPGAGKTLVGLSLATKKHEKGDTHAVFLSGNGPLVQVLHEALTQDEYLRTTEDIPRPRKGAIRQKVKAFIQNIHHFRDEGLRNEAPPSDHVVIFDEAQRAWNLEMTSDFMKRKKGRTDFFHSEPEFLISYLNRHKDWAVIVCLVGGGQEINRGEAGISAWIEAIHNRFPDWEVHISDSLTENEYAASEAISELSKKNKINLDSDLHLRSSIRSFRSENVSNFVKATLDLEIEIAKEHFSALDAKYPIRVTRNLETAKSWIQNMAGGTERYGMVASSGAHRLRPHAVDVRVPINPCHWFLKDPKDIRSSNFLEEAATEFHVQGLELDWVCVNWDADLRYSKDGWNFHSFKGSKWQNVNKRERQKYLLNSYRVLLTRARQGMVIFIPKGAGTDQTRLPEYYDDTFNYFMSLGIQQLNDITNHPD